MSKARLRYLGYQVALVLPAALCAVAVAQSISSSRMNTRLLAVGVVVVVWLLASARLKSWFFGAHLRQRLAVGYFEELRELYASAYELATRDGPRVSMALLLSICELERERFDEALAWLERIPEEKLEPTTRAILLSQRARALAGRSSDALAVAERAVELSRGGANEVGALTARGVVHLRAGRSDLAVADLERAVELAASGNEVPYLAAARARFLAEAYQSAGRLDDARRAYARAAAFPRRIPAAQAAAAALHAAGETA